MKYYIDRISGAIYAYELDGSQDEFIKDGLELLTDQEWLKIKKAQEAASAPTAEQQLQDAIAQRDRLLTVAGLRIAPLEDAIELDDASPGEITELKAWKQYRVALNRISQQHGFPKQIDWPSEPSTSTNV